MISKVSIKPTRDSYESYPNSIDFVLYGESGLVEITVGDRVIDFKHSDIKKLVKMSELNMEINE